MEICVLEAWGSHVPVNEGNGVCLPPHVYNPPGGLAASASGVLLW
jgi:hypothetical protein